MNDLFPEEELRAFLKATPDAPADPSFEAAVAAEIRRQQRRARLIPLGVILAAVVAALAIVLPLVPAISLQWMQLPAMLSPLFQALRPLFDLIAGFAACAPPLCEAILVQFGPWLCAAAVLAAVCASRFRYTRRSNLILA